MDALVAKLGVGAVVVVMLLHAVRLLWTTYLSTVKEGRADREAAQKEREELRLAYEKRITDAEARHRHELEEVRAECADDKLATQERYAVRTEQAIEKVTLVVERLDRTIEKLQDRLYPVR